MTPTEYWKDAERRAAKALDGKRIPCSGVGDIKGDVLHDRFFVECKCREKIVFRSWYKKAVEEAKAEGRGKMPILVVRQKYTPKGEMVVLSMEDFVKLVDSSEWTPETDRALRTAIIGASVKVGLAIEEAGDIINTQEGNDGKTIDSQ